MSTAAKPAVWKLALRDDTVRRITRSMAAGSRASLTDHSITTEPNAGECNEPFEFDWT
jgi:hypothetical protein